MKPIIATFAVLALAGAPLLAAQQAPPTPPAQSPAKPEAKPDSKAAPTVTGKWNMSVDTDQGAMASTLDMKIDGKKVTGTIVSQMGETTLASEFAEGKLTFWITMQGGGGEMSLTFSGAFKEDGTLAGTLDFGQGALNWRAERVKDK